MLVIRRTTKLRSRLAMNLDLAPTASTGLLGDWYATLLHTRRGQFVLAMSRATLLPIVIEANAAWGGALNGCDALAGCIARATRLRRSGALDEDASYERPDLVVELAGTTMVSAAPVSRTSRSGRPSRATSLPKPKEAAEAAS